MAKEKLRIAQMLVLEKDVPLSDNPDHVITIRPLGLDEIMRLLMHYRQEFASLWVEGQKEEPNLAIFASTSKQMVTEIIALASGRVDEMEDLFKMPGTTQLAILAEVVVLSVPNPKKLLEAFKGVLAVAKRLRAEIAKQPPLTDSATTSLNSSNTSSPADIPE